MVGASNEKVLLKDVKRKIKRSYEVLYSPNSFLLSDYFRPGPRTQEPLQVYIIMRSNQ